jgi:hypothetical protein
MSRDLVHWMQSWVSCCGVNGGTKVSQRPNQRSFRMILRQCKMPSFLLRKVRIVTVFLPILYSIRSVISNTWALNRKNDRDETVATVFVRASLALNDSPRKTAATPHRSCFLFNSDAWLRCPRLGNANHSFGMDDSLGKDLIISSVHWSNDNLPILLQESICEKNSIFMQREPTEDADSELRLWVVRLAYLYIQYHQHRYAFPVDAQCIVERQDAVSDPLILNMLPDNAKSIVVRFYKNALEPR